MFYQVQHFANFFSQWFLLLTLLFQIYNSWNIFFRRSCSVYHLVFFLSSIFFSVRLILSNTKRIFLANMSSAGAIPKLAFTLGPMRYMDKCFCDYSFAVSIPLVFLIALLNTLTNLSAISFDFGWQSRDIKCTIECFLQNSQNLSKKTLCRCRSR